MKKEKGVVIADHERCSEAEEEEREETSTDFSMAAVKFCTRNASSKYDFVKVKVWLGDNADHYYVLSRFLLSRMLTVTKIPNHVAIKIALELKKLLIDNSLLDVSQCDLEANLFKLMDRRGYDKEYINRYKMMTRFHHQRVPLVILVCGTACVGKSTIATQLAQRLNLPNVLQTEMVYELLRTATEECRIVRKGLAGDLKKAMKDGKPIIIEGIHLDPSIYLMDDENKLPSHMPTNVEEPNSLKSDDKRPIQRESNSSNFYDKHSEDRNCSPQNARSEVGISADLLNKVSDCLESISIAASVYDDKGKTIKNPDKDRNPPVGKEKSDVKPIIIPIVLKMADFDHKALLEEWTCSRTFSDKCLIQDKDKLISNLKMIQDYLCSFKSQGLTVVNISATTFPQTLDWLHSYLLQCIEQGISSVSKGSGAPTAEN
ncbi:uncharacterized protein LOC130763304 isoform X2 [Actinidia eriantha]|uniref:uncharacterized protein LOC130763304 isoform X2 n=1 Tax=Actinidia eriantha TaxID=165200 RepID=UPI002584D50C|nr:uncharacterized protein LOC130763304 isoform X2 [Actinidia eriantha]